VRVTVDLIDGCSWVQEGGISILDPIVGIAHVAADLELDVGVDRAQISFLQATWRATVRETVTNSTHCASPSLNYSFPVLSKDAGAREYHTATQARNHDADRLTESEARRFARPTNTCSPTVANVRDEYKLATLLRAMVRQRSRLYRPVAIKSLSEVGTQAADHAATQRRNPIGFQTVAIVSCGELGLMTPPNRTAISFLENQPATAHRRRARGRHSLEKTRVLRAYLRPKHGS
jgi:hypothetical protein